jgi:NAD(P)-dependent dehydrogenase (short-subunit alcohol dehydrogenase family)
MIGTGMLDMFSDERLTEIIAAIPLHRIGLAREAAGARLFLASDLFGYISGATIEVNGGSHIHIESRKQRGPFARRSSNG